jgi:DNA-3-methyladenine glycosylase I
MTDGLHADERGVQRCWWCGDDPLYVRYHDREWGVPVTEDQRLFEKICLEGFQAGLSWLTILRKRENFRAAFADFNIGKVARFTARDVQRLVNDVGIIRHRGKIESTINNAKQAIELIDEFGSLASYIWQFEPDLNRLPKRLDKKALCAMSVTEESKAMSKDLRKRGWSFVGPTTMQAFIQAMGMVNHHLTGCVVRERVEKARLRLKRPAMPADV